MYGISSKPPNLFSKKCHFLTLFNKIRPKWRIFLFIWKETFKKILIFAGSNQFSVRKNFFNTQLNNN